MRALVALALALPAILTGCVSQPEATDALAAADVMPEGVLPPLDLSGASCVEGGGHSVHPRSLWEKGWVRVVPEPWVPADVWDDVGPQVTWSEIPDPARPVPEKGNTMGNYHATTWCESWTFRGEEKPDMFLGFVGMKVEAPEFSDEAPTHHYVVTVIATNDEDVHAALTEAGFGAMKATATREALPDGTLRIQMHTDRNGDYDSLFKPKALGDMEAAHVRLWFQRDVEGHGDHDEGDHGAHREGAFQPLALDLFAEGGAHFGAEAQGYFSHSGTAHHDPLPGAYGHTAALLHTGFDRVVEWGPRPDVTLELAYEH